MSGGGFLGSALLAGTFVALACGACGWFVVLRGQVFAGDALSHVAFPGALAAAAAGVDERVGLFLATAAAALAIAALGRGVASSRGGRAEGALPADDSAIGVVFTFILGLGVFFLTRFSLSAGGAQGVRAARTLFGAIFSLSPGEARLAAVIAAAVLAVLALIARPLLFASVAPEVAGARGVPTRMLGVAFLLLLAVVAAEATLAVGALLLLGLLAVPAASAARVARGPYEGILLAAGLAAAAMCGGVLLAYALPWLPPSTAVVAIAVAIHGATVAAT